MVKGWYLKCPTVSFQTLVNDPSSAVSEESVKTSHGKVDQCLIYDRGCLGQKESGYLFLKGRSH